jgi:hypothetical protein
VARGLEVGGGSGHGLSDGRHVDDVVHVGRGGTGDDIAADFPDRSLEASKLNAKCRSRLRD